MFYRAGKKKRSFSFFFSFLNFDDILTLIQSKERKKYEVFVDKKIFNKKPKMTQKKTKNQNDKKNLGWFLYTLDQKSKFFVAGVSGHHISYKSGFRCLFLSFWAIRQPNTTISGHFMSFWKIRILNKKHQGFYSTFEFFWKVL